MPTIVLPSLLNIFLSLVVIVFFGDMLAKSKLGTRREYFRKTLPMAAVPLIILIFCALFLHHVRN